MDQQQSNEWKLGSDGFFIRGAEMTRLETFVDAAFAFTVTLLVVGGGDSTPNSLEELVTALKGVPAFLACFVNLMFFWYAHYRWSRRYGLEDLPSTLLSVGLVFVVLIYVYPLKAMYSSALNFFSGDYLPTDVPIDSPGDLRFLFVLFGAGFASMSVVIALLDLYAYRIADSLKLTARERFDTFTAVLAWLICVLFALVSIGIAGFAPNAALVMAGFVYAGFGIVMPALSVTRERRWKKLAAAA
ncbi:MAG: TMEM175 family protein [Pseudomonadota bacterium]